MNVNLHQKVALVTGAARGIGQSIADAFIANGAVVYYAATAAATSAEGKGKMTFAHYEREVQKGDFVYLPPWCVHGIENTSIETLVVLIATSPPNP